MELLARQFAHLPTRVLRERRRRGAGQPAGAAGVRRVGRRIPATPATDTPPRPPDRAARCAPCTRPGSSACPSRRDACSCSPCWTAPAASAVLAAASGTGRSRGPRAGRARPPRRRRRPHRRDEVPAPDDQVRGGRAVHARGTAARTPAAGRACSPTSRNGEATTSPRRRSRPTRTSPPRSRTARTARSQRGDVVGAISRLHARSRPQPDTDRTGAGGSPTRRTSAPTPPASSTAPRSCCATRIAGTRRSGETLHAAVATAYLLLNTDGHAETAHQLLTDAIESALAEPEQDHDGLAEALIHAGPAVPLRRTDRLLGAVPPGHGSALRRRRRSTCGCWPRRSPTR